MAYTPGANNVFVPQATATLINYTRDPKSFKINEMMTLSPVDLPIGKIFRLKPEAQGQLLDSPQAYKWPDGQPRPIQAENWQQFDVIEYITERRHVSHPIGYQTDANAIWDVVASQQNVLANKAMMLRAKDLYTALQDTASYATSHNDTATNLGGGKWDVATSTNNYIQKSLSAAMEQVTKSTFGVVTPSDMALVVGPTVARKMAQSQEIRDYLAQSPISPDWLQYKAFTDQIALWGLHPYIYGLRVIVDPLVQETARPGATSSKSFVAGSTAAYLITKPNALASLGGGPAFSTFHCFVYKSEEMLTEIIDVPLDKRKILTVTDNVHIRSVAPESGYLITAVL